VSGDCNHSIHSPFNYVLQKVSTKSIQYLLRNSPLKYCFDKSGDFGDLRIFDVCFLNIIEIIPWWRHTFPILSAITFKFNTKYQGNSHEIRHKNESQIFDLAILATLGKLQNCLATFQKFKTPSILSPWVPPYWFFSQKIEFFGNFICFVSIL
jgi:hypothetical protein